MIMFLKPPGRRKQERPRREDSEMTIRKYILFLNITTYKFY